MPTPTEISLNQKHRLLTVAFDDGAKFDLPCEYLRVYSPSAENRTLSSQGNVPVDKEAVNITEIEPVGNYAVRLKFDDGHTAGVYSWGTLYELGKEQAERWQLYLDRLAARGWQRQTDGQAVPPRKGALPLKLLYFVQLVKLFGKQSESVLAPASVSNVAELLAWLRERGGHWAKALQDDQVQVTINKQFANPQTRLKSRDEVAIVPTNPAK